MMQYAIVEFSGEDLVELVPVSWISGDMCKWPPQTSDVSKMIKKACDPEKDWKEYKVDLKGLFETYAQSRQKLDQSQYTSDLESGHEIKKRRRHRPARFDDFSSDDDDLESPTPPPNFGIGVMRTRTALDEVEQPPSVSYEQPPEICSPQPHRRTSGTEGVTAASKHIPHYESAGPSGLQRKSHHSSNAGSSSNGSISLSSCRVLLPASDFQRQVLRRLEVIQLLQQQQGEQLAILTQQSRRDAPIAARLVSGPFHTMEELRAFDSSLVGDTKQAFVNELSQIGGDHVLKATRRILVYLMADELAAKFSWLGRKGKTNFSKFTMASCIVDVVSAAHPAGKFCVEAGIKSWLVHAPDRIKQKANSVEANDD